MQDSNLINELDQLASAPIATAAFSDDPQHDTSNAGVGGANPPASATSTAAGGAGSGSGGGVESLKMLDSDDGADMEIFNDDEGDEYAASGGGKGAGRKETSSSFAADESPISWSGTGKKKVVSAALRNEIKELLNTPLTIPALVQSKKGRDRDRDRGDSDDDDADDHDDKSSESGEDYTDDEDEGESGYKTGGYHPVKVGDIFNQGYVSTLVGIERVLITFAIEMASGIGWC